MTCRHCGRPEAEHHDYEPVVDSDGETVALLACGCDPTTWNYKPVPVPCATFGAHGSLECWYCGHPRACHAPAGGDNEGG